MEEIGR